MALYNISIAYTKTQINETRPTNTENDRIRINSRYVVRFEVLGLNVDKTGVEIKKKLISDKKLQDSVNAIYLQKSPDGQRLLVSRITCNKDYVLTPENKRQLDSLKGVELCTTNEMEFNEESFYTAINNYRNDIDGILRDDKVSVLANTTFDVSGIVSLIGCDKISKLVSDGYDDLSSLSLAIFVNALMNDQIDLYSMANSILMTMLPISEFVANYLKLLAQSSLPWTIKMTDKLTSIKDVSACRNTRIPTIRVGFTNSGARNEFVLSSNWNV